MKKLFPLLAILLLSFTACKKTVESETKRRASNLEKVEAFKTSYSQFATFIEAEKVAGEAAFVAAEAVAEEEAKIEAMVAANDILSNGLTGSLAKAEASMSTIESKMRSVTSKAKTSSQKNTARMANENADYAMDEAVEILGGEASDAAGAMEIVASANRKLENAKSNLSSVLSQFSKENTKKKKKKKKR